VKKRDVSSSSKRTYFIFRWKDNGICVRPSRSKSQEEAWTFAAANLRPAGSSDDEAEAFVRKEGEVVVDE
jgi:hypothetical protein